MQQLDEFFKDQNEKFTIDVSKQNMHWQQMQENLAPKRINYKIKIIGVAAFFALLFGINWFVQNKKSTQLLSDKKNTDTIKTNSESNSNLPELPPINNKAATNVAAPTPLQTNNNNKLDKEKETNKTVAKTINKEAQFYIDLSKEPEIFSIDPSINNTITCKQGSVIRIPANSIVSKTDNLVQENVSVIVQEYYRYDEEITTKAVQPTAGMIKYEIFQGEQKLKIATGKAVEIKMKNGLENFKIVASDDALTQQEITKYNWISNEKFYTDTRTKIDYKITLNEHFDAKTFMSQIAFPKYNALLPGNIENNSLLFTNIPVGEPIYFISLGKVGKSYFSCSKKLVSGTTKIKAMDFLEISEAAYNQQLEMYGKLGKGE